MIAAPSLCSPQFLGARIAEPHHPIQSPTSLPLRSRRPSRFSAVHTSAETRSSPLQPMLLSSTSSSLYDVLGLPVDATCQEIKAAYRRLARTCHPDVVATDFKDTSADDFMQIHAAYSTLSDPDKRAVYDRNLMLGRNRRPVRPTYPSSSPSPSFSGYTRRTWETDQCW